MSGKVPRRGRHEPTPHGQSRPTTSIPQLRQRMIHAARKCGISRTGEVLLGELLNHANLAPLRRVGGSVVSRHWLQRDGCDVLKVWPSVEYLGKQLDVTTRTIERAIAELVEANLIRRERRPGGKPAERHAPNRTSITLLIVPSSSLQSGPQSPHLPVTDVGTHPTEVSPPTELCKENTLNPNHDSPTSESKPVADSDQVGLVCLARLAVQPTDPICPVKSEGHARRWGNDGPQLCDLTEDMIKAVVKEWPNLVAYTHEDNTMLAAWRKQNGYPPRSIQSPETVESSDGSGGGNRLVERMVANGISRKTAEALYEQHHRNPERIGQACFDAERGAKERTSTNPAGLIVSKLNKAKKRASEGYSWAQ